MVNGQTVFHYSPSDPHFPNIGVILRRMASQELRNRTRRRRGIFCGNHVNNSTPHQNENVIQEKDEMTFIVDTHALIDP